MAHYAYKLVPVQTFTSNWDERPTATEQLERFLAAEGEAGWHYPAEAVTIKIWATGSGDRHKHASLSPAHGGTHVLVTKRLR